MPRRLTTGGAFVLLNLLCSAAAFAQLHELHPFDMFCGVRGNSGPGSVTLSGTNPTTFFILTDIHFTVQLSPGDQTEFSMIIDGLTSGQRMREVQLVNLPVGTTFQTQAIDWHLTTGIAFPPGDEAICRVENIIPNRPWFVNFSGYYYHLPPAAVGGEIPSIPPSHLGQNVPNPFNPSTNITYKLASAGDIKLRFYDSAGRMVRTLIDGRKEAGQYTVTWDGKNDSGQALPSGVYYYELGGGAINETRKAILLK